MSEITRILTWIDQNPNKHHQLSAFASNKTIAEEESLHWDSFTKNLLEVPGCLSGLLFALDPLYRNAPVNSKKQILRETILTLEERIHAELVGRKWSRRKLCELVSAELAEKPPTLNAALEEALCELYSAQKLMIHHRDRRISFFPEDPRVWKSGRPLLVSDSENLYLYEPDPSFALLPWLQSKEDEGWKLQWPIADGKLEDLKTALEKRGLTARSQNPGEKVKKDDYARTLGRAEAISYLSKLREEADL